MSGKTDSNGNKSPMSHGDYVFRGAAIGAGAAGFVSLLRQAIEAKRQSDKKKTRESGGVGQDTIVLRVKKRKDEEEKTAEDAACMKLEKDHASKVTVRPCVECGETRPTGAGQPREVNGRFTDLPVREKRAGLGRDMVREGSGLYLGAGAAIGSFVLARRLFERLEQNRLKDQIAAAQTEYLDLLDGKQVKGAEAFAQMFMIGDDSVARIEKAAAEAAGVEPERLEKSAQVFSDIKYFVDNLRPAAQHIGAGGVLMYLLGVTGSAYVAKKLMDQRFAETGEEPPHKVPKIVMKAAEAEFEVQPEQVLATIGIMRDCISDSTPEGLCMKKMAADYKLLGDISNAEGGKKWLLDAYAKTVLGLDRNVGLSWKDVPLSLPDQVYYGSTLSDIRNNPGKHADAIKSYMFNNVMRKNPKEWFALIGEQPDLVSALAEREMTSRIQGIPLLGWLARMFPGLGNFFSGIPRWWVNNTASGKRFLMDSSLSRMGVSPSERAHIMKGFSPNEGNTGWTAVAKRRTPPSSSAVGGARPVQPQQENSRIQDSGGQQQNNAGSNQVAKNKSVESGSQKTAGFVSLGDILALASRAKTVSDTSNDELYNKIVNLDKSRGKSGEKEELGNVVSVRFDDELDKLLSKEDKEKIISRLSAS